MQPAIVCDACGMAIVGAPCRGALAAHRRHCRGFITKRTTADRSYNERVLTKLTNNQAAASITNRLATRSAESMILPNGPQAEIAHDPAEYNHTTKPHLAPAQPGTNKGLYGQDLGEPECETECKPECNTETPDTGWPTFTLPDATSEDNSEPDSDGEQPSGASEPAYVENMLIANDIIAWMLKDLTAVQQRNYFMGVRLLEVLRRQTSRPEHERRPTIHTVEALNKYLDVKADKYRCKMTAREVPIVSDHALLRQLAPVPLFIRPIADVFSCSLQNPVIENCNIRMDPVRTSEGSLDADTAGRVVSFMHGSAVHQAKQVPLPS